MLLTLRMVSRLQSHGNASCGNQGLMLSMVCAFDIQEEAFVIMKWIEWVRSNVVWVSSFNPGVKYSTNMDTSVSNMDGITSYDINIDTYLIFVHLHYCKLS